MKERNKSRIRFVSLLLTLTLIVLALSGCDISSKHLEVTYEENDNEDITEWGDVADGNVTTWDTADIETWSDIDEYSDWVYSELLFDAVPDEMPIVECRILDYRSNGKYFDGEKIYELVGDKFDVNSFIAKYAVGSGVIIICVILHVATAGGSTPIVCFFAGAADYSVSMAVRGAAFGAATKAVIRAIQSDGDFEETLYGALEGSADGYMWGAIYGSVQGGFTGLSEYAGSTYHFPEGSPQATKYPKGIPIDEKGYPDFSRYAKKTVRFDEPSLEARAAGTCLTGNCYEDFKMANKAIGLKGAQAPAGYTWHHHQDMRTMQLVPQDIHSFMYGGYRHSGGASLLRQLWAALEPLAIP